MRYIHSILKAKASDELEKEVQEELQTTKANKASEKSMEELLKESKIKDEGA